MWQDTVIAVCQSFFVVAMWPSIKGPDKPAFSTSVMNVILVGTIATTLATLKLWFSVFTAALIAACWTILAVQKSKLNKKRV